MFNLLAETQQTTPNWLLEILKLAVPALSAFVGVLLAIWIWHHKKRREPGYESLAYLNRKRLDGLLKAFSLLVYITEVENPKAVMIWEKTGGQTTYYLRPKQSREYMVLLSELFYAEGYGLLLGKNIKERFYECRGHLYGVLLKAGALQNGDERIRLEKEGLAGRIKEIYTQLNTELRRELKKMEKQGQ